MAMPGPIWRLLVKEPTQEVTMTSTTTADEVLNALLCRGDGDYRTVTSGVSTCAYP
jgi:hypothetical protein